MKLRGLALQVARKLRLNTDDVHEVAKALFEEVFLTLETEEPVSIEGFGEFFFEYKKKRHQYKDNSAVADTYDHIRVRKLRFEPVCHAKAVLNNRVADIGIESSKPSVLSKAGLKPKDLPALRRESNKIHLDMKLKLRKMTSDITMDEVASNLTYAIDKME